MLLPRLLPRLEAHERDRLLPTALAFMCVATGALVARTTGDALFLSYLGSGPLPFMYIGGAVATGLGSYACAKAAGRLSTARVGILVAAFLILANVGVYLTLGPFPVFSRAAAYLLADLAGRIPILLFWAYACEIFDARESRRLFGLIGAAGTAACLPAGLLIGPLARRLGTESMTWVVGALMAGFILAVLSLSRREGDGRLSGDRPDRRTLVAANAQSLGQLHRYRQFIGISAVAAATAIVQTLIDYQFKASFAPLAGSAALASVFGTLYAVSSLASLFIQMFLVHRLLEWGGVLVSLCALPGTLLLASAATFPTGSPRWVFTTKALDVTLTLTVNGTARQMLYRGIRSESRLQARAIAEGLYQPMAVGLAGFALALATGAVTIRVAAGVAMIACAIWLLLCRGAYLSYVSGLVESVRARWLEADDDPLTTREPALQAYVRTTLASAPDDVVVELTAILPQLGDFTGAPELRSALARESPKVKVAILDYLRERGGLEDPSAVLALTRHADPEVRRSAVRAAAAPGTRPDVDRLRDALQDPAPGVRAAGAAALIDSGISEAATAGRAALETMVDSPSQDLRAAAAEGIKEIRAGAVTPLLARLLDGQDDATLLAALEGCRSHPDPELVPRILPLLARPRLAGAASDALAAVGTAALGPLTSLIEDPARAQDPVATQKAPELLARIGDPAALRLLKDLISRLAPEDRTAAVQAYSTLVARQPSLAPYLRELDDIIAGECRSAASRLKIARDLPRADATRLVRDAAMDQFRCHLRHAFLLLAARIRTVDMKALHSGLTRGSKESRSQALELLENVLPDGLRRPLLDLLEQADLPSTGGGVDPGAAIPPLIGETGSEWIVAGALYAASGLELRSCAAAIRVRLAHPSPVVRETALFALSRIEERPALLQACLPLTKDPDRAVRDLALSLSRSDDRMV